MTEGYEAKQVQVGLDKYVTFFGKQVAYIPGAPNRQSGVDASLYATPEEGLKLYVKEWVANKATDTRGPREEAKRFRWVGGGLFSEKEAHQRYPALLEVLLEQKHRNSERDL